MCENVTNVTRNFTVACIDDEASILEYLDALLTLENLEAEIYHTPFDFIDAARSHKSSADVVLTDLVMPGLTGIDLAYHIQSVAPELPVVLYTGNPETIKDALPSNIVATLIKPVASAEILNALRRAVNY